ncbi:hypothetical protein BCR42DRAFT_57299 [Absidia repens]|uniref:PHD-type domain-containing protein n=1 Tax=Absidia repens TaxID=90262 RepID=A0A1X2IDX8_9FUNG|nr:hypothetical protein BCR42DRAFT_57299 [Absidia repens]
MTAQRRSRNGVNGRKKRQRQQQQRQRRRSQSTTDEGSSDEGSITRCLCGETHNSGLMVQCDKCEVWQHCECMGLAEEDIPDQYYCEECKPENHASSKMPNGRTQRSYSSEGKPAPNPQDKKTPKKRMTMNSQEASLSLEDVLAVRQALGFNHNNPRTSKSPSMSPTTAYKEPDYVPGISAKRKRQESSSKTKAENQDIKQDPSPPAALPPLSETVTANELDNADENKDKKQTMDPMKGIDSIKNTSASRSTKAKRNATGRSRVVTPNDNPEKRLPPTDGKPSSVKATDKKGRHSGGVVGRRNNTANSSATKRQSNKPRSRTSTPQPNESSSPLIASAVSQIPSENHHPHHHHHHHQHHQHYHHPPHHQHHHYQQQQQHQQQQQQQFQTCTTNSASALFDHFSKGSRATSPPAKIRYPTSRMTISEMNRRAKQILEYITSLQVEMANKSSAFGSSKNNESQCEQGKAEKSVPGLSSSALAFQQQNICPTTTAKPNISNGCDAIDTPGGQKNTEHPTSIVIPEVRYHDGPSSSLSSASTIPLDDNNPASPCMDLLDDGDRGELSQAEDAILKNKQKQRNETSLDIMDILTGELIKFQRKFGSGSYSHRRTQSHHSEASSSTQQQPQLQDEGRVTRSGNNGNGVRLLS